MDSIYEAHREIGRREHDEAYSKVWSRKSRLYRELSKEEFDGLVMINNYCLLRITREDLDFMETGSGVKMSTYYEQNKWAPTYCEVVKVPDKIVMRRGNTLIDMEWETDIEVVEGDMVVARYLPIVQSLGMGGTFGWQKTFRYDNDLYVLIGYQDLIVRFRDDGDGYEVEREDGSIKYLWPLNGYVINEPVASEVRLVLDRDFFKSGQFGRVCFVGSPIKKYAYDYAPDDGKIEEGQMMLFTANGDSELMRGHMNTLGRDFRRIPKRHCLCAFYVNGLPMTQDQLYENV